MCIPSLILLPAVLTGVLDTDVALLDVSDAFLHQLGSFRMLRKHVPPHVLGANAPMIAFWAMIELLFNQYMGSDVLPRAIFSKFQ